MIASPSTAPGPPVIPGRRAIPAGVLLVNLGTPDSPRTGDVRRYLREFLSDPRVIDVPAIPRALLLNLVILPLRPAKSAEAYRKIWTERGSPLLVIGEEFTRDVQIALGPSTPVILAMRYGRPSIASGLAELRRRGVDRIVVFPLYPQGASSSTGTVLEKVYMEAGRYWNVPDLVTVPPFFDEPGFLDAWADVGRPMLQAAEADHVLLSFHGLPERQIRKSDDSGRHCLSSASCCDTLGEANRNCYRAQCFATSRLLAERLGIPPDRYTVTFQSRLGRTPWIRPYTDLVLAELPGRGVKRLAILSPAFVADCLETLEELAIRGKKTFLDAGGESFTFVPSLNTHPRWVETAVSLIRTALRGDA